MQREDLNETNRLIGSDPVTAFSVTQDQSRAMFSMFFFLFFAVVFSLILSLIK